MSEEKLQNLIETYPQYASIFRAVFNWFNTHPKQLEVSMDLFYTSKYSFPREEINIAFMIMKETSIIKTTYRLLDDDGTKIGKDFENLSEIPKSVDTMWGDKKNIEDVFIVPYYSLIK